MDNNSATQNVLNIINNAKILIETIKTGDGLGFSDDQKIEFKNKMDKQESKEAVAELEKQMDQLRKIATDIANKK